MGWGMIDLRMNNMHCRYWYSKSEINPSLLFRLFDFKCSKSEIDSNLSLCCVGCCLTGSQYYNVRHTKCYDVYDLCNRIKLVRSLKES